ncbi:hypothetical protein IWQ60_010230 [Tieghemiomyces parasiticus]|uniref:F-box domain-containing protein n=1 Tax=Tieghemiomyces parasiticus TaxID=78921 RepID=A0A9W7ZRE9_9FUNG|nr:hypothetical protein IWQ60_010230 [Tieghemiomyces parasiticus]
MKVYYLLGAAMLSLAYAHPMLGASTPATTQDACGVRGSISLDTLPAELIEKIVSHLEATQLLQVAATSHKLATVTMNAPTATHELANAYYRRIFSDTTDPHSISPVTGRTVNDFFELPPPVRVAKFYALLPAYHSFLCNVFYRRLVVQSTEYLGITPIGNIYKAARPHFLIPWFRNQLGWATYPLAQETPMEGIILGIEYLGSAADYTQQFQAQGMPMAADMAQILHASLPRLRKIHHSAQVLPLDPRFTPTRQLPAVRSDVVAYAMSTGETEFLANLAIYFTSSDFRCTLIEYLECIIAEEDLVLAYNLMLLTNTVGGKNLQPLSVATRHPVEDKAEALGRHLAAFVNTDFMDDVATALVGRGNLRGLQDFNERLSQSQPSDQQILQPTYPS